MPTLKARQIAKIIGKTDKTVHNHRTSGKISMEKDIDGEYAAEISEVQRAYSKIMPNIAEKIMAFIEENPSSNSSKIPSPTIKENEGNFIEEKYKALLSQKDAEIERMNDVYEKSLKTVNSMTRLLEHSSARTEMLTDSVTKLLERESKKKDEQENNNEWQQSLKALETRIANQEKAAKEKAETDALEKTALKKQLEAKEKLMEEQVQALQEAKDAELKRKEDEYESAQTWVSKMFGKKKTA